MPEIKKASENSYGIAIKLFSPVFDAFREISTPDDLQSKIQYELKEIPPTTVSSPLRFPFYEQEYYLYRDPESSVFIDSGFHQEEGLVHFSFLLNAPGSDPLNATLGFFEDCIIPMVEIKTGLDLWKRPGLFRFLMRGPFRFFLTDKKRGVTILVKMYPATKIAGFTWGMGIFDQKYA